MKIMTENWVARIESLRSTVLLGGTLDHIGKPQIKGCRSMTDHLILLTYSRESSSPKIFRAASDPDHLIGTSAHTPQRPMVTYTGMGTVDPDPQGLLRL
ncbi:hypothetical protein TNCV_519571 [Trichonephila clavipes]|nr:hypothetical protein TNCV_519571 [Trichonephila clavipes]